MLWELRQYHIRDGKKDEWVSLMENEIIPFHVSKGMVILGSFTGEEDENIYIWMRRFENESERERLYKEVYDSDYWKDEIGPKIPELMDREKINVTRLDPTPLSPMQ